MNLSLADPVVGGALISAVVFLSVMIQILSSRRAIDGPRDDLHGLGFTYMSAIGTLYAVVLGLTLVDAASRFDDAIGYVEQEPQALLEVYAGAVMMPEKHRKPVADAILKYLDYVANKEWQLLENNESSHESALLFREIWYQVRAMEPETENQKAIYPILLESFKTADEVRRQRVTFSHYSARPIEWFCLISGGGVNIGFSLFFRIKNQKAHAVMSGLLAFMISTNLYAVYLLSSPYARVMNLTPDRFSGAIKRISGDGIGSLDKRSGN